jgi:hypothetical protein
MLGPFVSWRAYIVHRFRRSKSFFAYLCLEWKFFKKEIWNHDFFLYALNNNAYYLFLQQHCNVQRRNNSTPWPDSNPESSFLDADSMTTPPGHAKTFFFLSFFSCETGLPDGIFSNQKSQFGYILEGLAMLGLVVYFW